MEHEECLIEIKFLINKYFQDIGRDSFTDTEEMRIQLIDEIDSLLENVELNKNKSIMRELDN